MRHRPLNMQILLLCALLPLVIVGCGGGGGGGGNTDPVVIDKPVSISIVSPASSPMTMDVSVNPTLQLSFKVDGPSGKQLPYTVTWDKGSVDPASGTVTAGSTTNLTFTPPSENYSCNLTITVSNGNDVATKTVQVNVTGNVAPPTPHLSLNSITANPLSMAPGETSAITVSVNNPNSSTITYTWSALFGKISGSGTSVTWTAPQQAGVYGVYLVFADGTTRVKTGIAITVTGSSGGLLGQYYKTTRDKNVPQLTTLAFSRIDPLVNFEWYKVSPGGTLGTTGWGARWTGFIKCTDPGTYTFRVHVDDGAKMSVVNDAGEWQWVIPGNSTNWTDHDQGAWLPAVVEPITLNGGKWYPIQLDFFQGASDAFITLYWSVNGAPEVIVPQDCLKPPA